MTGYSSLIELADRVWNATWELDEMRGDTTASEWTAQKVRSLIRSDCADDLNEVRPIAEALESYLARHAIGPSSHYVAPTRAEDAVSEERAPQAAESIDLPIDFGEKAEVEG